MSQDIHVTSKTLARIQADLRESVIPGLERLKSSVDTTHVPMPGFGIQGIALGNKYDDIRDDVKSYADDAIKTVRNWIDALETIKRTWAAAEAASTVVYQ
ncbi:hypothetical protein GCM10022419_121430 [Nonomuraea rosea]|uniref:WXG100 family type VII secretion target n=1 Tax=Nonomuraea rosea TaxID=638574 RepID=A0ABP6ZTA2_9ACTN